MSFSNDYSIVDIIGMLGVLLYLGSYALLQFGVVRGQTYIYASMNLVAAGCVLVTLTGDFNLSSALIQISWIVISIGGMIRLFHNHMVAQRCKFTAEEQGFLTSKLPALPRNLSRMLLDAGRWADANPGDALTRQGQQVNELVYIAEGTARVELDGNVIAYCHEDSFVGEFTCLSGEPATATVRVDAPARMFYLSANSLRRFAARRPELRQALDDCFATEARLKLLKNRSPSAAPAVAREPAVEPAPESSPEGALGAHPTLRPQGSSESRI